LYKYVIFVHFNLWMPWMNRVTAPFAPPAGHWT